jgi:hypothetical protein
MMLAIYLFCIYFCAASVFFHSPLAQAASDVTDPDQTHASLPLGPDYQAMTPRQLRQICKQKRVKWRQHYTPFTKEQMIAELQALPGV